MEFCTYSEPCSECSRTEILYRYDFSDPFVHISIAAVATSLGEGGFTPKQFSFILNSIYHFLYEKIFLFTLGLMQRDYPDIVVAVKTRQAVQTVLNTAFETLKFMISGGIVDKNEGNELHKVIQTKLYMKHKIFPLI